MYPDKRAISLVVPLPPGPGRPPSRDAPVHSPAPPPARYKGMRAGWKWLTGREVVFTVAENLVITSKSDDILIPVGRNALLAMGASWYAQGEIQNSRTTHLHIKQTSPVDLWITSTLSTGRRLLAGHTPPNRLNLGS